MISSTAEDVAGFVEGLPHIHEAKALSGDFVLGIQCTADDDSVREFSGIADRGWRVAFYDPNEHGHRIGFVPIGDDGDDGTA